MEIGKNRKTFSEEKMKASEWAFDRIKEAFEQVAQDEAEKVSIVQEITLRSTDYLRCIIAPVGGQGGVAMSCLCPHCNSFPLEDCIWWVSGENIQSGGAQFVEKSTTGSNRTGCQSYKQVTVLSRPRYSKHMHYLRAFVQIWSMRQSYWRISKKMEMKEYCEGTGQGEQKRSYERLACFY